MAPSGEPRGVHPALGKFVPVIEIAAPVGVPSTESQMPELPDVEIEKRYLEATALHTPFEDVEVNAPRMLHGVSAATLRHRLTGRTFEETTRRGKYLFAALGKGTWLVLHFGMTGYLKYFKQYEDRPEHTRLLLHLRNGYLAGIWERRLGRIGITESPDAFAEKEKLGPDALDPGIELEDFRKMLRGKRGAIKSALMDQRFIAGIGNIYSDEILFQAAIHPTRKANELNAHEVTALHRAMRHVLRLAIEREADPERLPASWLLPHREEGADCPRCGGKIGRIKMGGRSAYVCPRCQA